MIASLSAAIILAGLANVPAAAGSPLASYYDNTFELSRKGEKTVRIYIHPDGGWDGIFGQTFFGGREWRIDGDIVCFFNPPGADSTADHGTCFRGLGGRNVGETWEQIVEGEKKVWSATLARGRTVPLNPDCSQ